MRIGLWFFMPVILMYFFCAYFSLALNTTDSLEHTLFIVKRGALPDKHDQHVLFKAPKNGLYAQNFLKKLGGMEGDLVWRDKRTYFINERYIGDAKAYNKQGQKTRLGSVGVLPTGKYFVYTNHQDSYDSRYQEIDWVDASDIIGVAYPLF